MGAFPPRGKVAAAPPADGGGQTLPLPPGNGLSGHTLPTSVRFANTFSPREEAFSAKYK